MSEQRLKQVEILLKTCAKVSVNHQANIRSLLITQAVQNQKDIMRKHLNYLVEVGNR